MRYRFTQFICHFLGLNLKDFPLVAWSILYLYGLLSSYFLLRPLRDELGLSLGTHQLHWLFTLSFLSMLMLVPLFSRLCRLFSIQKILHITYWLFLAQMLCFYGLFSIGWQTDWLATAFFVWLSLFNLLSVSLFWSFMIQLYNRQISKRIFGLIATGGSLGAISGPLLAAQVVSIISADQLLLLAIIFFIIPLWAIQRISLIQNKININQTQGTTLNPKAKNRSVLPNTLSSQPMRRIAGFMLLYTSTSTLLYFTQAHLLEDSILNSRERLLYFSQVDLLANILAVFGQLFLTGRIIQHWGLAIVLSFVPFLIGLGLFAFSIYPTLPMMAGLIVTHRVGNLMLLRPGREILFAIHRPPQSGPQVKSFIDTAVYRGGDALSAWCFTGFLSMGWGLSVIAVIAMLLTFVWAIAGYRLGKGANIVKF